MRRAAATALALLSISENVTFEDTALRLGLPVDELEGCITAITRDVEENDDGELERTVGHCFMLGVATGIALEEQRRVA